MAAPDGTPSFAECCRFVQAQLRAAGFPAYADRILDLLAEFARAKGSERERCARLCEEVVTFPAGHGGQWEGYGPVKVTRDGKACAAAIRALPDEP